MMRCDSCGQDYSEGQLAWCPHSGAGLQPGTVRPFAIDDDELISLACNMLEARIKTGLSAIDLPPPASHQMMHQARSTPFIVWFNRQLYAGPNESLGMGWRLLCAIPPDSPPAARAVLDGLPDQFNNIDVFVAHWDEAPDHLKGQVDG
jgi:hypothetical protein